MASVKGSGARKAVIVTSIVFLIIFLINILPGSFSRQVKTIFPIDGQYMETISSKAIFIRDEKVYENPYAGEVFRVALEGERVPFGAEVADVLSGVDLTLQKDELMDVEKRIELLEAGKDGVAEDTISKLQNVVSLGDYSSVHELKGDLMIQFDYYDGTVKNNSEDIGSKLDTLRQRRDELRATIDRSVKRLYSSHSGLVSFEFDGFEELIDPYDLEKFKYSYFSEESKENLSNNAFKIIDGFDWFIAIGTQDTTLEKGDTYEIIIKVSEDEEYSLKAPIVEIKEEEEGRVCFFRSNILLSELYDVRHAEVVVIKQKVKSLKLPKEAVIYKEGKPGVLVKEFYGVVRFRQVNIIGEDDEFIFVEHGDSYGYIEDKAGKRTKTVNIYTEILLDTGKYSEGEILE